MCVCVCVCVRVCRVSIPLQSQSHPQKIVSASQGLPEGGGGGGPQGGTLLQTHLAQRTRWETIATGLPLKQLVEYLVEMDSGVVDNNNTLFI